MDRTVRNAALISTVSFLVYGGTVVLLAGAAFCVFWRVGLALTTETRND